MFARRIVDERDVELVRMRRERVIDVGQRAGRFPIGEKTIGTCASLLWGDVAAHDKDGVVGAINRLVETAHIADVKLETDVGVALRSERRVLAEKVFVELAAGDRVGIRQALREIAGDLLLKLGEFEIGERGLERDVPQAIDRMIELIDGAGTVDPSGVATVGRVDFDAARFQILSERVGVE